MERLLKERHLRQTILNVVKDREEITCRTIAYMGDITENISRILRKEMKNVGVTYRKVNTKIYLQHT